MNVNEALAAAEVHQIGGLENGSGWGFRYSERGVEWRDDSGDAPEWHWLCDPLEVAADTRDTGSENWGRLLVFEDRDGVRHEWAAATADLSRGQSGEVIAHLARLGFVPPVSAQAKIRLLQYIVTARPAARLRAVGRVGWKGRFLYSRTPPMAAAPANGYGSSWKGCPSSTATGLQAIWENGSGASRRLRLGILDWCLQSAAPLPGRCYIFWARKAVGFIFGGRRRSGSRRR